jgi:2,3-bisphosphoglycerate-independent phosphoglycerate mutase
MRRVVLILPELLGEPSVLRQKLPTLGLIAELGSLFKLGPMPKLETPEALYLGLRPDEGQLRQGPLTVSALGADPPERSTHFHLSLMSFSDGVAVQPNVQISAKEAAEVVALAKKLNTKALTFVEGENLDHGLVWEGVGDLGTSAASEISGKAIKPFLPEGDAEVQLRRYIDDSINLLSEIELNQRRIGEELPPINLLWPWGHGVRRPVPNLALRRGHPALVVSESMRLQGLTRLSGYRHSGRSEYGRGLGVKLECITSDALRESETLIVNESFSNLRRDGRLEEAEWLAKQVDAHLIQTLFNKALVEPMRLTVLAPGSEIGLGASFETRQATTDSIPFDERAFDEKALSTTTLWDAVATTLA